MKQLVSRFTILFCLALTLGHSVSAQKGGHQGTARLDLVEATVPDLLKALQTNLITSEQLVDLYLARIAVYDNAGPRLNAFLNLNPNARAEARHSMPRASGIARSPLDGIPMSSRTTSTPRTCRRPPVRWRSTDSIPQDDAFVAKKLREAGAIILGKATHDRVRELPDQRHAAGYSSLGGYGYNPYDPRPDPRALDGARQRRASRADAGRIELGPGHRGRRESRRRRHRHRDVGIDPEPGERRTCSSASSRRWD